MANTNGGLVAAIIAAVSAVLVAAATGLWQWLSGRKKSEVDANASVINGFILLVKEMREERSSLLGRLDKCEQRVNLLYKVLNEHNMVGIRELNNAKAEDNGGAPQDVRRKT